MTCYTKNQEFLGSLIYVLKSEAEAEGVGT
jgi:hypothetical protein